MSANIEYWVLPKTEYKVIGAYYSEPTDFEEKLNELAKEGWRVVGLNPYHVILEKITPAHPQENR